MRRPGASGDERAPNLDRLRREGTRTWAYGGEPVYKFPDLAAGRWVVGAARADDAPIVAHAILEVAEGQLVEHDVSISDTAGPLAQAGLKEGDLLIGVDGTAFQNEEQMSIAMAAAKGKARVTFRVRRAGAELDLALDPRAFFAERPGGRIWPSGRW